MGDFNIDLLKYESSNFSKRFSEQMFISSFFPLITKPTRITQHCFIDNIFTNDLDQVQSSSNGLIFADISDYLPMFRIASVSLKKYK